ncbi:MAG TPA: phosphate/phosphite/phosphonate ABC transporter substrate-binding protein, partial [Candidatus Wallbacteria bacterium]|nr:phosphate/phosphite/phosphonate ABC transporter substrate-binding protein [Candidatus Wallbacteria bacterium]
MSRYKVFVIKITISAMLFLCTAANFELVYASGDNNGDTASISVLKVGRIPYLDPRKMVRNYESMMEYLKNELKITEVRLVLTPDYNALTQFLKEGKIDVAWHGTFAYPRAREVTGAKAILTPIWSGKKSYCGIIVARADSNINKIEDLKGRSFAFTDKKSASGYFLPKIFLLENKIDPEKDFSKV